MNGFKNISDIERTYRYCQEPWSVELDEMLSSDRKRCVMERFEQNKKMIKAELDFDKIPSTVGDIND